MMMPGLMVLTRAPRCPSERLRLTRRVAALGKLIGVQRILA
jgi:hypothetical protein